MPIRKQARLGSQPYTFMSSDRSRPAGSLLAVMLLTTACGTTAEPAGAEKGSGVPGVGGAAGALTGGAPAKGGEDAASGAPAAGNAASSGGADTAAGGRQGLAGSVGTSQGGTGGTSFGGAGAGGNGTAGASPLGGSGGPSGSGGSVLAPLCARTTCTTCGPNGNKHNLNNDDWAGTLTLFISYSSDTRSQTVDKGFTASQWNAAVDSFNVPAFAAQVQATGAKNILLMLGQNTGYYCSPNSVYEKYAGVAPGTRTSTRDLPMEIADTLAPKGIGMYLYLPEDVGWGDKKAANNFGLSALALDNWVVDGSFTPKWNAVVKAWADRYRTKVKGWFFDGFDSRWGVTLAMGQTYRNTALAANPCGIVTLNGANGNSLSDTERGETRLDASTGLPAKGLPTSRWTSSSDIQTMWAFPLQAAWGQAIADNSPAIYTNANLSRFIVAATKAQTVFALDVRTSFAGQLSKPIYEQLVAIKP